MRMRLNPAGDIPLGDPYAAPPKHSWGKVVYNDFIFGGDSPAPPPPPDYTPLATSSTEAAQIGAALGREQLAETRRQYDINRGVSDRVSNSQIALMDQARTQGDDYYNYMKANQRPVEESLNRQSTTDFAARDAADRAAIGRNYDAMQGQAEADRQGIMSRYDANQAADVVGRAGLEAQSRGQQDANMAQRLNMDQFSAQQMAEGRSRTAGMDQLSAEQMADARSRTAGLDQFSARQYGTNASRSQAMRDYANQNDAANTSERGLMTGGNRGIYDARRADIDFGVDNATADARSGMTQQAGMLMRQAARLGYSPERMAAAAATQGYSNAGLISSRANAARTAGIDQARGLIGQNYQARNAQYDQSRAAMGDEYAQGNQAYDQRYGAMDRARALTNEEYAQRYAGMDRARAQSNEDSDRRYAGMDRSYAQGNQVYDQRRAAMAQDYDSRNASNDRMTQGLLANRGMNMEQGQLGLQRNMNNRNLRLQDDSTNWARKLDVAGLYRNLPGASQGAYGVSTNAGNAAVANTMQPGGQLLTGMAQGAGMQQSGMGQKITGLGGVLNAQNSYNNMVGQYNASQNQGGGMGALLGAGAQLGSAYMMSGSDRRLKQNIKEVGTDEKTGLPLYEFSYIGDSDHRYRGVMSDDVRKVMPQAIEVRNGYDYVNYGMLGIQMVGV